MTFFRRHYIRTQRVRPHFAGHTAVRQWKQAGLVLCAVYTSSGFAYERLFNLELTTLGMFDSNYDLVDASSPERTLGLDQRVRLDASIASSISRMESGVALYSGIRRGAADKRNQYYDWFARYQYQGETGLLTTGLDFRDSNELDDDELTADTSNTRDIERKSLNGKVGYRWQYSERGALAVNFAYRDVSHNRDSSTLYDFGQWSADVAHDYALTETVTPYAQLSGYRIDYDTDATFYNSAVLGVRVPAHVQTVSALGGVRYQYSPLLAVDINAGVNRTQYHNKQWQLGIVSNGGGSLLTLLARESRRHESGLGFNLSAQYEGERGPSSLTLSRHVSPNGSGIVAKERRLQATQLYRIHDTLSLDVKLTALQRRSADTLGGVNQNVLSVGAELLWRPFSRLLLAGQYRALQRELIATQQEATSHGVQVRLSWRLLPLDW